MGRLGAAFTRFLIGRPQMDIETVLTNVCFRG